MKRNRIYQMFMPGLSATRLGVITASLFLAGCVNTQKSNVSVDFYNISGNSTAALDREIKRKGPRLNGGRHAVAVARIKMIPNITYQPSAKGCDISKAKVAVDAKVTLPKWTGRKSANKELGEAWDNIDRYTRLHEAMHVAIAFRFAKQMEKELIALQPAKNCDQMKALSKQLVDDYLKEHDRVQKQFDADEQSRFLNYAEDKKTKNSG